MVTLWLHLKAPFAAFRWMQAGVWRGTSPVIPPSAAWGLVLNLAGIESRSAEPGVTTGVRDDVPHFEVAIGTPHDAVTGQARQFERATLYQQLHSYPVGAAGKELEARAHGQKYWIAPVRRELLIDFEVVVGVRAEASLANRVRAGLRGELDVVRYGLPFAGDNSFLFESIDALDSPPRVHWYTPLERGKGARAGSARLTIGIDRRDASGTTSELFAPHEEALELPPAAAWVFVPRAS